MTNSRPGTTPYLSQFADCDGILPRSSYRIVFEASFDTSLSTPALV